MKPENIRKKDLKETSTARGAALLIVLAVIVVTLSATASLARLAGTAVLERSLKDSTEIADQLLSACEEPIQLWLTSMSASVVLPASSESPRVHVLDDEFELDRGVLSVQITAWDQRGMLPLTAAITGSPLRLAVSDHALHSMERVAPGSRASMGLDHIEFDPLQPDRVPIFPSHTLGDETAIGALVSTHPEDDRVRVNINTSPIALIESAMRLSGRGGIEQITAARDEGRSSLVGSLPVLLDPQTNAPQLVAQSDCWAFRIDIRVASIRRSWWAVYQQSASNWECVQRLAITS